MGSDLELLEQLDAAIGRRLPRMRLRPRAGPTHAVFRPRASSDTVRPYEKRDAGAIEKLRSISLGYIREHSNQNTTGFAVLDQNDCVVAINLYNLGLDSLPNLLREFNQLHALEAGCNHITTIDLRLLALPHLSFLDLHDNQIRRLPREFFDQHLPVFMDLGEKRHRRIDNCILLISNPLESPPPEIVTQGREAVNAYFDSLEQADQLPLNELKVILVGDGASGKTSLVKQLLGHKFNKNESQTHGIRIRSWKIDNDEEVVLANLWDFGGQEIMHATHQFFLSRRSLYILVLDSRKDEKTEYWLKHIKSFGGDSPVLVVLNKIDENPGFDVNRKFLKEKYPSIVNFYKVSCKSRDGIKRLSEGLFSTMTEVEMLQTTWPSTWFDVKTRLEKMTRSRANRAHYISYEEYTDLCTKSGVHDAKSQEVLVEFLNDLGVMLHFPDFELEDTHVLDPKWVTNGVYRIINSKALAKQNGVLRLNQLRHILRKAQGSGYAYPRAKYRYIVDLMKKFELCYQLGAEKILVPDLLPVLEADFKFDFSSSLRFVMEYDFLPKSIMPRLLVNVHTDIMEG